MKIIIKRKTFTQWDETDNLKRMKDADILAEKKKPDTTAGSTLKGAALGGAIGGVSGAIFKGVRGGSMSAGGVKGALLGAGIGAIAGHISGSNKAKENKFYNDRLKYAQRQALRREKKDWKTNMTQRDGYSY